MAVHDLIVIGAGPGGYVAAIRAAQFGMNVGIIEKEAVLGGTCLRVGCIPSKALLESSERFHAAKEEAHKHGIVLPEVKLDLATMMSRKDQIVNMLTRGIDGLMKKNKITRYSGHGRIDGAGKVVVENGQDKTALLAKNILIATGSKVARLPGVELDFDRIGTSTEALKYPEVPKHLIVIGAGVIGLELGSVWLRLGAKVTVLEYLPRILPGMDTEIATEAQKIFEKQGFEFRLGSKVKAAKVDGSTCIVEVDGGEPLRSDRVLLAVGRVPNTENLGLDTVGIQLDQRGRIPVNDHFATPAKGVYAIGDVIRGAMLAHKAEEEGVACVEKIATGHGHVNYDAIPGIVYTEPEIASVGKTEEELKAANIEYRKGVFPFQANGRARCIGHTEGRVKVLAHAKTDRVLGVHIIGPRAGDLIAEAATAIEFGASSEDVARACHAHPTLSEAVKEASLAVAGRAIHF
ncbi:MAG TPA: dihydrolipoyl dehydrogenase [Planctomycetota bacterium]|nr:dihydrolipoyl dehydrogenase [Planctomycetota bacterium]